MAFPFIASSGLEGGTLTNCISTTAVSGSLITCPHYSDLARYGMAPYRGAYCLRVQLAGGTTSQFIRETAAFDDWTANVVRFVRFYFYLGLDLVMADTNKFTLFDAESTEDTTAEIACGIIRSGDAINFWVSETAATAAQTYALGTTTSALGKWFCAEIRGDLDNAGADDGTIDAWINDSPVGAQITTLDQGVIVDGRFGVMGPDAGTSGTVLIDDIMYDDTQVYRNKERFRSTNAHIVFAADHPIIGPGKFALMVTGTSTDAVANVYDTDGVPTNLSGVTLLRNLTANEGVPGHDIFEVQHGAYVTLSGTGVQAYASISKQSCASQGALVVRGRATKRMRP